VDTLFDGRAPTRWIAEGDKRQWVSVNLGRSESVSKVILRWVPDSHASQVRISISSDGSSWTRVFETNEGKGGNEIIQFSRRNARFVRLDCLKKGGSEGSFSLFAFEVYR
jgi:hypothetical protein